MGESISPFEPLPEDEIRATEFDPDKVKTVDAGAVGRAEASKANEFLMVHTRMAGKEAGRARSEADFNGEYMPPKVHTPSPEHLRGLSSEDDRYPGPKPKFPDMDIDDPENLIKFD